jgi:hypothetical protein
VLICSFRYVLKEEGVTPPTELLGTNIIIKHDMLAKKNYIHWIFADISWAFGKYPCSFSLFIKRRLTNVSIQQSNKTANNTTQFSATERNCIAKSQNQAVDCSGKRIAHNILDLIIHIHFLCSSQQSKK